MANFDRRAFISSFSGAALALSGLGRHASATNGVRIVMIHGCCQPDRSAEEIGQQWLAALKSGAAAAGLHVPQDVEFVFPYYGAKLGEWIERYSVKPTTSIVSKGNSHQDDYLRFQLELAEELLVKEKIPLSEVGAEYQGAPGEKGPLNWEWVQAVLRTLEARNDRLAQFTLDTFTRDAFLYLNRKPVRNDINNIILKHLDDRPTIVVAHSLGTVVAYDVLRSNRFNVPLFVTLGSPLGLRTVSKRLTPIAFPQGVSSWNNFYDDRDPVALYPLDSENFRVDPEVSNISDIQNGTRNRHGIDGYLSSPSVVGRILE
ncbi:hypothetical protein [Allomesorhizobium camelthorni]|uniref:Alpha/beta hydrolase n=1 Tax=Allomesorhizobium camelthorni TaxID=475069 RepID=A0A6G4WEC6_9HYPH|nr:hypothetical protein [Mesorhizobium camelthorni]NGO52959.1 hypothetical protein [Mesorhizobium camelthorni]